MSPIELVQLVELGEAEAYADLFDCAPPELGLEVQRFGGVVALLAPKIPIVLFNRVIGLGVLEPAPLAQLEAIGEAYHRAGVHVFAAQICPQAQPKTLPASLEQHAWKRGDNWAKVYRHAEVNIDVPTRLRLECIGLEDASDFARIACLAHGMPPALAPWLEASVGRHGWHHYIAWDDNQAVAVGTLFVKGKVGWLGIGGTLPSHRRQGAQGAIMAARIREAAALGCDWVITETGEHTPERPNPSFHNMIRTGFQLAYQRPNFVFHGA